MKDEHEHWVLLIESTIDCDSYLSCEGVYHSQEDAVKNLKKAADSVRQEVEESGYEIFEDSEICFDAGILGDYISDHIVICVKHIINK